MNDIDIANIKKELAKRKADNYEWKDGGEMTKDDVSNFSFKLAKFMIMNSPAQDI